MKPTLFGADILSGKSLLTALIEPPDWEVTDLVAKGQRVMLIGQWGAYKSWLLQHLALSLAMAPGCWLDTFQIPTQRRVLYLDKEMSVTTAQRRLQRLAMGLGLSVGPDAVVDNFPLYLVPHPRFEMSRTGGQQLLDALDAINLDADVIVLETFRRVLKGSENDQEDVSAFWDGIDPIFKARKTLYCSHHMRKPKRKNEQARNMGSGSTDILAGADAVFALERGKTPGCAFLEHLKNRDGEEYNEMKPTRLQLEFRGDPKIGPAVWSLAQAVSQAEPTSLPAVAAQKGKAAMIGLLARQSSATTAQLNAAAAPFGAQRTVERWRSELEGDGKIIRSAKGHYSLTPMADSVADD